MALPAVLSNVLVQQGNGQVLVSWDYQAGATGYSVQRSLDLNTWVTVGSPTTTSYLDTSVTVGTVYYYQVAGVNGSSTGPYSTPQDIVPTIAGQMTLGQLRGLSQERADRVNSNFVTTTEWNTYINQSYFELYDILVQKYGNDYFVAPETRFVLTGQYLYPLPDGISSFLGVDGQPYTAPPFYKLLGVDLNVGGQDGWLTLKRYMFIKRNAYVYPQLTTNLLGVAGLRYRQLGNNLSFIPTPSAGQMIRLWYIPRLTTLLSDNDIADGVSGWLEYVVVDAAIKALAKEESDISALVLAKEALLKRIEAAAENRDAGEPETISDTRRFGDSWGWGDDGNGPIGGV